MAAPCRLRQSVHAGPEPSPAAGSKGAGCDRIFEVTVSGTKTGRPELAKALDALGEGETRLVRKLDRCRCRLFRQRNALPWELLVEAVTL
jgi:DNA invertase Pin-like site-specific DNA recombinase